MKKLVNTLNKLAKELRKQEVSCTTCDKLRIKIDQEADKNRYVINDLLLYRKIKDVGFEYHNNDMEYVHIRYALVAKIYLCVDLLTRKEQTL